MFQLRNLAILSIIILTTISLTNSDTTLFFTNFISRLTTSQPRLLTTTSSSILIILVIYYLNKTQHNLPALFHRVFSLMNSNYRFLSNRHGGGGRFGNKSKYYRFAMQNGGAVGGISNEGNTCFMNSVIQSLASSRELLKFIDSYLYEEISLVSSNLEAPTTIKSDQPKQELVFTNALKTLLDNVNGKYGRMGKEFSSKQLLNKMPNGPKQNFFSGYNQEDAQEFYQLVMNLLEREHKNVSTSRMPTPEPEVGPGDKYIDMNYVKDYISGVDQLGKLGVVYVPASQVDPNLVDCDHKLFPLELITPVDGVAAERIGCLTCGEVGGIRYSVTSGLSLNLPHDASYYSSFNLNDLLNQWITPEIIEDVNCNRCGLIQTRDFLVKRLQDLPDSSSKLVEQFQSRLSLIEEELNNHHITDEIFEKLTIKKQIKKSKKSKQIYLSRPPPLLCIHINRSVFDPRTYSIVKNPSNVTFPIKLNMSDYTVEPKDINMDARLPFRKQDQQHHLHHQPPPAVDATSAPSSSPSASSSDEEVIPSDSTIATSAEIESHTPLDPKLLYNLKSVISHYGTHNYGHYICYRKLRGSWWRISDESVYVVSEEEVLNGQGTFLLFYEYDDGYKEDLEDVSSEEEEEEQVEEKGIKLMEQQSSSDLEDADYSEDSKVSSNSSMQESNDYDDGSLHSSQIDLAVAEAQVHL
ncbi:Ubiquitin carboxyl-terminal hydrolase 1 [Spathaspora sp. JA1]|nr:Ubiquitin carboxyl-terminal hydrolase 1 [Spathaspora sp. JA1]